MYFATNRSDSKDIIKQAEVAGKKFPSVQQAVHIGNTIHKDGSMEQDIKVKRALFVDACHNLQAEFYKVDPKVSDKIEFAKFQKEKLGE